MRRLYLQAVKIGAFEFGAIEISNCRNGMRSTRQAVEFGMIEMGYNETTFRITTGIIITAKSKIFHFFAGSVVRNLLCQMQVNFPEFPQNFVVFTSKHYFSDFLSFFFTILTLCSFDLLHLFQSYYVLEVSRTLR